MHYAPPVGLRIRRDDPLLPLILLVYLVLKAIWRAKPGRPA